MYHVTENQSTAEELVQPSGMGLLLYRISFTHPRQIPEIILVRYLGTPHFLSQEMLERKCKLLADL